MSNQQMFTDQYNRLMARNPQRWYKLDANGHIIPAAPTDPGAQPAATADALDIVTVLDQVAAVKAALPSPATVTAAVAAAVNAALPALVAKAVADAIAAHPVTVDATAIANAVEARFQAQFDKQ